MFFFSNTETQKHQQSDYYMRWISRRVCVSATPTDTSFHKRGMYVFTKIMTDVLIFLLIYNTQTPHSPPSLRPAVVVVVTPDKTKKALSKTTTQQNTSKTLSSLS